MRRPPAGFYRRVLQLDRTEPALIGQISLPVTTSAPQDVIAYRRGALLVLVNARAQPQRFTVPDTRVSGMHGPPDRLSLSTATRVSLGAFGAVVLRRPAADRHRLTRPSRRFALADGVSHARLLYLLVIPLSLASHPGPVVGGVDPAQPRRHSRWIRAGASPWAIPPARSSRASTIGGGACWICRTTGASRERRDEDAPGGGKVGYFPTGIGWYRKAFRVPAGARGSEVWLEFDGVYMNSDVWINGVHLGQRPYGYISFAYDVTAHLVPGVNVRGGPGGQLPPAQFPLVLRQRHLSPRLADRSPIRCTWATGAPTSRRPGPIPPAPRCWLRTRVENDRSAARRGRCVRIGAWTPPGARWPGPRRRSRWPRARQIDAGAAVPVAAPRRSGRSRIPALYPLRTEVLDGQRAWWMQSRRRSGSGPSRTTRTAGSCSTAARSRCGASTCITMRAGWARRCPNSVWETPAGARSRRWA